MDKENLPKPTDQRKQLDMPVIRRPLGQASPLTLVHNSISVNGPTNPCFKSLAQITNSIEPIRDLILKKAVSMSTKPTEQLPRKLSGCEPQTYLKV